MKNRSVGAATTINPLTYPKKDVKQSEKITKSGKRGLAPTHLELYCCCKQYITQALIKLLTHDKQNEKKNGKKAHREERARTLASYRCEQYSITSTYCYTIVRGTCTAVKRYNITTAAASRTESDYIKNTNHQITETKKNVWVVV